MKENIETVAGGSSEKFLYKKTHFTEVPSCDCPWDLHRIATCCLSSKAMAFPVVMYGCESWNIKRVERQCIEAFQLWH